jgi:integrase
MLLKCPECELQISDKATFCPHCGYPIQPDIKPRKPRNKNNKRKRLPNGFGQISQIKNRNLRNPYRAMVTVGKTSTGRPICKPLKPESYFPTYNDAYAALVEYNKNPYDLKPDITVKELYEKWTAEYFKNATDNYIRTVNSAWAYCSSIYDMRAKDIRSRHIKGCMEEGFRIETRGKKKGEKVYATPGTKSRIKSLFNNMLDYALEYEIVPMNYARTFELSGDVIVEIEKNKKKHFPFDNKEMDLLWKNVDDVKFTDWIIIQCYMGWRPQELATLRLDEVNLEKWYMQAGMKTEAGKQRIVPIHSKIKELVKRNYDFALSINSDYLFNDKGQTHSGSWSVTYDKYASRFEKVVKQLNLNPEHRPHDPHDIPEELYIAHP